jgi:hypothetical protein
MTFACLPAKQGFLHHWKFSKVHTCLQFEHNLYKAWTDRQLIYNAQGRIFNNMLYVQHTHLTKAEPTHKKQTHPLVREDVT